jgi:hypothetical protein
MSTIEQVRKLNFCEDNYGEFVEVMDNLKPQLNDILVNSYQQYLTEKLGKEVTEDETKDIINSFFEDYRYTDIFE